MKEEWRIWRLKPVELVALSHEYDIPESVSRFEDEWCASCPYSDEGTMRYECGYIIGGGCINGIDGYWLLEHFVNGELDRRYCLLHPKPPYFREPECADFFMTTEGLKK